MRSPSVVSRSPARAERSAVLVSEAGQLGLVLVEVGSQDPEVAPRPGPAHRLALETSGDAGDVLGGAAPGPAGLP